MQPLREVLIVGDVPPACADPALPQQRLAVPAPLLDGQGRLSVRGLVRLGARQRRLPGPTLVLTARDLALPPCRSLFGFADRRAAVAVVSLARLRGGVDAAGLRRRVENEVAHELGHLSGLVHCRGPACVMVPVKAAHELDDRAGAPCGRCPRERGRARQLLGAAAALLLLALAALGVERLAALLAGPPLEMPFT